MGRGKKNNCGKIEMFKPMNNETFVKDIQSIDDLSDKTLDESCRDTTEPILFEQLEQIHGQKLERNAQMVMVHEMVKDPDASMFTTWITISVGCHQNSDLQQPLSEIRWFVFQHFECNDSSRHTFIPAFDHLSKCALSQNVNHSVP